MAAASAFTVGIICMPTILLLHVPFAFSAASAFSVPPPPTTTTYSAQLLSSTASSLSLVSGLTARFECSIYYNNNAAGCVAGEGNRQTKIDWYKDDILLFNGTEFEATSGIEPSRIILQRSIVESPSSPSPPSSAAAGQRCTINGEERYTLMLRNLRLEDSGRYRCQLLDAGNSANGAAHYISQQLDFRLDVLESDLRLNFSKSLDFDHIECCMERGVSPLCRPMCRPRDMDAEFFDPTSCQVDDYKNFLHCATGGGKRDYVPCCREKALPPFCFDFCSNNFQLLKKSHRLCLYYLPDIFDCFSRQFALKPPPAPMAVWVTENRKLCWQLERQPRQEEMITFSVHAQEMPGIAETALDRKRRRRRKSSSSQNNQIQMDVVLVQEGGIQMPTTSSSSGGSGNSNANGGQRQQEQNATTTTVKLHASSIEWASDHSDICIPIGQSLRPLARYMVYVEASNEHGTSERSKPVFIDENGLQLLVQQR